MSKKPFDPSAFFRHRQRVYVMPTGAGVAMLALVLALILMSAVYASPSLQFLGFFLFALFTLSFAWTHAHLGKLDEVSICWADGHSGENAFVRLRAHSGRADLRQGLEIKLHLRAEGKKKVTLTTEPFTLERLGFIDALYPVALKTVRGRWNVQRVSLGTSAPFGLASAWVSLRHDRPLWIYPRRKDVVLAERARVGAASVAPSPGAENFRSLEESPWMTSALHVVPKPSANLSAIVVKKFEGEEGGIPTLEWHLLDGDAEERLSKSAEALHRWQAGGALALRTPYVSGIVRSEEERKSALVALAEAPA